MAPFIRVPPNEDAAFLTKGSRKKKQIFYGQADICVTSDGSDGTQNDPGHPENEWE